MPIHVAIKLGINSYRTALAERSLKRLLEQAHTEENKFKEKVVAYLLKLMENYSKLYRTEGDPDSSCSSHSDDTSQMKGEFEIESISTFNNQVLDAGEEQSRKIRVPILCCAARCSAAREPLDHFEIYADSNYEKI
jgi:hypothetical protein